MSLSRSALDVVGFGELIPELPAVSALGRLGIEAEGTPGEEPGVELEEPELLEELELLGLFWELELEELPLLDQDQSQGHGCAEDEIS